MALNFEQKQAVVAEVAEVANKALAAVAAEYRGLTVEEMTELRVKAREDGVYVKVAKNTLVRRAVEGTEYECMQDALTGPLLLAFSMDDPGAAARLVKDYAKDHDKLELMIAIGAATAVNCIPCFEHLFEKAPVHQKNHHPDPIRQHVLLR